MVAQQIEWGEGYLVASDEALAGDARRGDSTALDALLDRYRSLARARARAYYLVGADREDLVQEGMIGLYKAVRDYSPEHGTPFRAFADLCIGRQILTAVKAATRYKHGPLNGYVSFSRPVVGDDDGDRLLGEVLPHGGGGDPADAVISGERLRSIHRHLDEVLSGLEAEVLRLYVDGRSYTEIAVLLHRHTKAIDNALQRIKRKLDSHLRASELADSA